MTTLRQLRSDLWCFFMSIVTQKLVNCIYGCRLPASVRETEIDRAVPTPGQLARFGRFRTWPRQNIRQSIKP